MATNWTLAEATKEILAGNKEAIQDVGRRFPLTANAIASMGNNTGALTLINAMPDYITARKIEAILKDGVQESDDVEEAIETKEEDVKEEKPAKKEKAEKKPAKKEKEVEPKEETADDSVDYSKMTAVELFKLCKKRGIKVEPKQKADVYFYGDGSIAYFCPGNSSASEPAVRYIDGIPLYGKSEYYFSDRRSRKYFCLYGCCAVASGDALFF